MTQNAPMMKRSDAITEFNSRMDMHRDRLFNSVPRCVDKRMLDKMARRTICDDPTLLQCSWQSLACAISDAATLGLSIGKGLAANAYVLAFRNTKKDCHEATLIVGYKGMIDLARRSGQLQHIAYDAVREGDHFVYSLGLRPECDHKPSNDPQRGQRPITHAYCCGTLIGGGSFVCVMTRTEIEEHRAKFSKRSTSPDSPWVTAPESMYIKTVIRRAFNRRMMPMGIEDYRLVDASLGREDVIEGSFSYQGDEPLALEAQPVQEAGE